MPVYESGEMYLETILRLQQESRVVHAVDIAEALNVSRPSVSRAVQILQESGYIRLDNHKAITLTASGKKIAAAIFERHEILTNFFTMIGVSPETAEADACRMEHVISEETFEKIKAHFKQNQ
ncbi:MAG: metal-dependent transcriptional regulator [Fibrobacteraceae bacterium]|jgi:Mn-dependent DtxR family transcriptional regulator|nr:metal-dependent transcriptional regulator [Fibrobacteraceae bacterium]MEE1067143.1 metal-dependent transcriptional regulator [Fibrobacteraceae bacterium]